MGKAKKLIKLGDKYQKLKRYGQALNTYLEAHKAEPSNKEPLLKIADMFFKGKDEEKGATDNELKKALDYYLKALEVAPEDGDIWKRFGVVCNKLGLWQKSVNALEKAIKLKADAGSDAELYGYLGKSHEMLRNWDEMLVSYKRSVELEPENIEYLLGLARAYMKKYDWKGASEALRKVLEVEKEGNYTAWYLLAVSLNFKGDFEEALKAIREAMKLKPNLGAVWEKMGMIFMNMERKEEALYCYERASDLGDIDGVKMREELRSNGVVSKKPEIIGDL
ncbi:MAG: tetratricopeptide repeat protein [Promethearchaeota archaeon]